MSNSERCITCRRFCARGKTECRRCAGEQNPGWFMESISDTTYTAWFHRRPDIIREIDSARSTLTTRLAKYGLTPTQWAELVVQSNSRCFICGTKDYPLRLSIDHDHVDGHVRGLLCSSCNTGLGHLQIEGPNAERRLIEIRNYLTMADRRKNFNGTR